MQISERSVHLLIEQLKDYKADICYSRINKTYRYCNDFELNVSISVNVLTNNEVTQIFGGSYFLKSNLLVASQLQCVRLYLKYKINGQTQYRLDVTCFILFDTDCESLSLRITLFRVMCPSHFLKINVIDTANFHNQKIN